MAVIEIKRLEQTHTPLMRIPGIEPASEGGRFVALFDKDDRCVVVTGGWVGPQVFVGTVPSFFGLLLVGKGPNPQENLR